MIILLIDKEFILLPLLEALLGVVDFRPCPGRFTGEVVDFLLLGEPVDFLPLAFIVLGIPPFLMASRSALIGVCFFLE